MPPELVVPTVADHGGFTATSLEEWRARILGPGHDISLWHVARRTDTRERRA